MLEHRQAEQRVPGLGQLGEGVGLPRQAAQPVPEHPVQPLDMHRGRPWDGRANRRSRLDLQEPTVLITVLDGLGQRQAVWHPERWAAPPPGRHRPPIGAGEHRRIGAPAVAAPGEWPAPGSGLGLPDRCLRQGLLAPAAGVGDDEAADAVLDQAAPAIADIRRVTRPDVLVLLLTNDQNSSTSTTESPRSRTSAASSAPVCRAASRSQWAIVSYLCPDTSSAARRLPRRMTTSKARPISAGGVRRRYSGVPCVSPNQAPQP